MKIEILKKIRDKVYGAFYGVKAMGKRAQLGLSDLQQTAIVFVVVGVTFGVGLQIMGDTDDAFTPNSPESNASRDAIQGSANVASKLPLIGTVIAAVIVIGLIIRGLGRVGQ